MSIDKIAEDLSEILGGAGKDRAKNILDLISDPVGAVNKALFKNIGSYFKTTNAEKLSKELLSLADEKRLTLTTQEKQDLECLIKGESFWSKINSQLAFTDRRGVMLIGPSGAGKTTIQRLLIDDLAKSPARSTSKVIRKIARAGSKVFTFFDAPGRVEHGGGKAIADRLISHSPRILCLVFANGFLHSEGERPLWRQPLNFTNINELLDYTTKEEIDWIKELIENLGTRKPKWVVNEVIIVVNKLEFWFDRQDKVRDRYVENSDLQKLVQQLTDTRVNSKNLIKNINFFGVSAQYDSFRAGECQPAKGFYAYLSSLSILLLRAHIANSLSKFIS